MEEIGPVPATSGGGSGGSSLIAPFKQCRFYLVPSKSADLNAAKDKQLGLRGYGRFDGFFRRGHHHVIPQRSRRSVAVEEHLTLDSMAEELALGAEVRSDEARLFVMRSEERHLNAFCADEESERRREMATERLL